MPRTCTACGHPQRPAIDAALLAGEPFRHIAERFGTSATALTRHKRDHIPAHVATAKDADQVAGADDLLAQVRSLQRKALDLLVKAEAVGDYRTALAGVREARACVELLLEVEGELDRRGVTNIIVNPEWVQIRTAILVALQPYPDAAQSVAGRLAVIEGGTSHAAG